MFFKFDSEVFAVEITPLFVGSYGVLVNREDDFESEFTFDFVGNGEVEVVSMFTGESEIFSFTVDHKGAESAIIEILTENYCDLIALAND